jgi:hypothetical protein
MRLFKFFSKNSSDWKFIAKEELIENIKFYKHKFSNRIYPKYKNKILFITCFSEFGCESIGLMYCIPRILKENPDLYVICIGWYGRQYLYKHLVDEFWEIHEEFQFLRDRAQAFCHHSKNLTRLENELKKYGNVYPCKQMGNICIGNRCLDCNHFYGSDGDEIKCQACGSKNVNSSLFSNIPYYKKFATPVPQPDKKAKEYVQKFLKPNSVGIFARSRKTYGRNLSSDFYIDLISLLEKMGYNPIWLGEKQSVMNCPVPHIFDFSRKPESRDLELTLAIISQLCFTIQFWTASTRLASMVNVPWILFETPDQIVGKGQEGKRIALTTDLDKKKLIISHYPNVVNNTEKTLDLIKQAIKEMQNHNWEDIIGLVEEPEIIRSVLQRQKLWR